MNRAKPLLSIAALVLTLAVLGFEWHRSAQAERNARSRAEAELSALRAETERLREAVSALQGARPAANAAKPGAVSPELLAQVRAAAAQHAAQSATPPAPPLTEEQEREQFLRYGQFLDDRLARAPEPIDAPIAAAKTKLLAQLDDGSSLIDLECGKELCRARTRHTDLEVYRGFLGRAFQEAEERVFLGGARRIHRHARAR